MDNTFGCCTGRDADAFKLLASHVDFKLRLPSGRIHNIVVRAAGSPWHRLYMLVENGLWDGSDAGWAVMLGHLRYRRCPRQYAQGNKRSRSVNSVEHVLYAKVSSLLLLLAMGTNCRRWSGKL